MKRYGIIIFLFLSVNLLAQNGPTPEKQSDILFKITNYDFGDIEYMEEAKYEFIFKNISKRPIAITNVKASCGCTSPEWSKEPIRKRKKGSIVVTYDTKRSGKFNKSVYVYTDRSEQPIQLRIRGNVVRPNEKSPKYDTYQKQVQENTRVLEEKQQNKLKNSKPIN